MSNKKYSLLFFGLILETSTSLVMSADEAQLAKDLANPVANLINFPIQIDYDENYGTDKQGAVWKANVQPVIPFEMSEHWIVISRTILPVLFQNDYPMIGSDASGIGDTVQSFFISPKAASESGVIWGLGPVLLLPTASDDKLGGEKWGAGPTGLVLKQDSSWTVGVLANHIESFAGEDNRDDISQTLIQPFINYLTQSKTSLVFNIESTYNWNTEEWTVPVNFTVMQMLKIGEQILQAGIGMRYWAQSPDHGAEDWGARFQVTFLFPR